MSLEMFSEGVPKNTLKKINGIIVINKPPNLTSHDIVYKVKKIVNEKVGHTGTLDPMATGVLPLLIGKGTLCSKYLINHDKTYEVKLKLGIKTTTADIEGDVIEKRSIPKDAEKKETVEKILKSFLGKQKQIPPIYSAIKVKGKKLYEYARKGKKIELEPRNIEIYEIQLLKIDEKENIIEFNVKCSKGTYIRSLCEDIAVRLGTIGHMCGLNRIQVGQFSIENSITIEELEKEFNLNSKSFGKKIITIENIFRENKSISLNDRKLQLFLNGVKITQNYEDGVYKIYNKGTFIGIGIIKENLLKRDIII